MLNIKRFIQSNKNKMPIIKSVMIYMFKILTHDPISTQSSMFLVKGEGRICIGVSCIISEIKWKRGSA